MESPLNNTHYNAINKSLASLNTARLKIAAAKEAGIDMGENEQAIDEIEKQILGIKRVYFPGRP